MRLRHIPHSSEAKGLGDCVPVLWPSSLAAAAGTVEGTNVRLIGNTEYNNTKTVLWGNQNARSQRAWGVIVPWEAETGGKLELVGSSNYCSNNNNNK